MTLLEDCLVCKKTSDEVLVWLSVWSEVQMICIWSSWCHCQPIISCFIKIQTDLMFLVVKVNYSSSVFNIIKSIWILKNIKKSDNFRKKIEVQITRMTLSLMTSRMTTSCVTSWRCHDVMHDDEPKNNYTKRPLNFFFFLVFCGVIYQNFYTDGFILQ